MTSRTQLLKLELAEAEAAEELIAAKEHWPVCSECGRNMPDSRVGKKIKGDIYDAKAILSAARRAHREAREAEAPNG